LPVTKQCKILQISRSSVYYDPVPFSDKEPYLGSRGIKSILKRKGYNTGRTHIRTLMRKMGIEALYKKPCLSKPHPGHKVYPYLLGNLNITKANEVWCSDITYIPMARGFCYLVAIMDWASRKILSFRLSNTLDVSFCIEALEEAIYKYGKPDIFNTDQGSQFTSLEFINILIKNNIKISMDGRNRWMDNIFIERFWKTLKYQEVYLKAYESISHARKEITHFIDKYNTWRPHQRVNEKTPDEVYYETLPEIKDAV